MSKTLREKLLAKVSVKLNGKLAESVTKAKLEFPDAKASIRDIRAGNVSRVTINTRAIVYDPNVMEGGESRSTSTDGSRKVHGTTAIIMANDLVDESGNEAQPEVGCILVTDVKQWGVANVKSDPLSASWILYLDDLHVQAN